MSQENEKFIRLFKALANDERLEIIKLLKKNKEMYAQDIEHRFFLEQSTTSHHLNTLKRAGITKTRKEGRKIYYAVDYERFLEILVEFETLIKTNTEEPVKNGS